MPYGKLIVGFIVGIFLTYGVVAPVMAHGEEDPGMGEFIYCFARESFSINPDGEVTLWPEGKRDAEVPWFGSPGISLNRDLPAAWQQSIMQARDSGLWITITFKTIPYGESGDGKTPHQLFLEEQRCARARR